MSTIATTFVTPYRHPLTWTRQKVQMLLTRAVGVYLGVLIIVAIYYLLFETTKTMNNWWHTTVPNSDTRHAYRDVGEFLLGGLLGIQLGWNHYKHKVQKQMTKNPNLLDRLEMKLHIPNIKDGKPFSWYRLLVTPVLVLLYAAPGFYIGLNVVSFFHHHHFVHSPLSTNPATSTLAQKSQAMWTQDWPKKLVGYFAAFFFGRRPAKVVFDDVQTLFAERKVMNATALHWYHTPAFKARVRDLSENGDIRTMGTQGKWISRLVLSSLPIAIGLAGYGWYILNFIAK